jgi:PmbA protein
MTEDLKKRAAEGLQMALAAGADDAVAHVGDSRETEFTYRDGKLEEVQQSTSSGLSLQLYVDGRYSTHGTTDLRPEQVRRFVEEAVALTRHLEPDPHRVIPDPALYTGRPDADLDQVDPSVDEVQRDTCLDWLKAMDEITHGDDRVISATSSVSLNSHASARVSSNSFEGTNQNTYIGYGSQVAMDEGDGRRPEAYRGVGARYLADLLPTEEVAREALERGLQRLGSGKAPSARTAMVVDPEAGGNLLGRLGSALSAGAIQQNRSFLADKKDQQITSELLTIIDEPLLPRGLGSRRFDGEGISAKRMPICEKGVLRTYYVDTYYGRKLGWEPTTGGPSNIIVELGDKGLDELIADAGDGFYVDGWLGGNADPTTGDFSFGIRGHRIENGAKGAPITEMNITGNYLELLQNLVAVGNDPNPWSSFRTPTLVFENVEFSGQ